MKSSGDWGSTVPESGLAVKWASRLAYWLIHALIRFYQWVLSPVLAWILGSNNLCRFSPTCSEYAREAFEQHGVLRGGVLTVRRLARCQPFSKKSCGYDPIPPVLK